MPRFLIPLGIVAIGVIIYSLVECLMTPKHRVRAMPKAAWVLVVLLVPVVGALLWLFLGRARGTAPSGTPRPAPRPTSPDDDEAFLRQLDIQRRQQAHRAELDRRETELRAREQHPQEGTASDSGASAAGPQTGTSGPDGGRPGGPAAGGSPSDTSDGAEPVDPADPSGEETPEDSPERGRDNGPGR